MKKDSVSRWILLCIIVMLMVFIEAYCARTPSLNGIKVRSKNQTVENIVLTEDSIIC